MYTIMDFTIGAICIIMLLYSVIMAVAVLRLRNINITVKLDENKPTYTEVTMSDEDKKYLEEQQAIMDVAAQLQNLFVEDE